MTDKARLMSSFRRQPPPPAAAEKLSYTRKQSEAFLDDFAQTKEENIALKHTIEDLEREYQLALDRITLRDRDLAHIARMRDQYMAAYAEVKLQVEGITMAAIGGCEQARSAAKFAAEQAELACQTVIDQAKSALDSVRAAMAKAGVNPDVKPMPPANAEDVRIGQKFGPAAVRDAIASEP